MRKILLIAKLCSLFIVLFLFGCRKHDTLPNENSPEYKKQITEKFFTATGIVDPSVTKVINKLKQYPDYFPAFIKRNGFAKWDKAVVFDLPKQRGGATILNDMTTAAASSNADVHIVLIPLLKDGDKQVKNMLAVKVVGDSIRGSVLRSANYKWYNDHAAQQGIDGSQLALLFMKLDEKVFGHTRFTINDSILFRTNNKSASLVNLSPTGNNPQSSNSAPELMDNTQDSWQYICVVVTYEVWKQTDEGQVVGCSAANPYCNHGHTQYVTEEFCNWGVVYGGTGGGSDGGGNTGNPGNPSGDPDPWGTGGPGGGGDPGGTGEPPIDDPCAGSGSGVDPRDPGSGGGDQPPCTDIGGGGNPPWTPVVPATLAWIPVIVLNDNSFYEKNALFGNPGNQSSTYIFGNGVAVKLPVEAKIIYNQKTDPDILPNGALYAFELNGKTYVSVQKAYTGGLIVPAPEYIQFFEINPDTKQIIDTKPLAPELVEIQKFDPDTKEPIKAVRIRVVKNADGSGTIVRELVSYTPSATAATTISGGKEFDYEIKYAPVVPGSLVEETRVSVYPGSGSAPTEDPSKTLTTFINSDESRKVKDFLKNNTFSETKIYLTDFNTNKVTHTITKDGVTAVPAGEQDALTNKFATGNLGSNDEEIAIKAGITNGVWYYDVKLNRNRLGTIPDKMNQALEQVITEITKQANKEVERLRMVGSRGEGELVEVNGERFFKAGMNLLETLAAVWDLGKQMIKNGALPERVWDDGTRSGQKDLTAEANYKKSPITTAAFLSGGTDQFFEDVSGPVQLVSTGLDIVLHPRQSAKEVYEAVRNLTIEKIKQLFNDASGISNYNAGGKRATYQGGRHTVQAATIFFTAVKLLAKANKLRKAGTELIETQSFIPDGSTNHPAANAFRNAAENNFEVRKVDDDKILTSNKINNERQVVAMERNGSDVKVYTANVTDLTDPRTGHIYTEDEIFESAKDFDKPKVTSVVNGRTKVEIEAGSTGSWTKELNNPKPNTDYHIKNTGQTPHKYSTDAQGRVVQVEAELKISSRARNGHQQTVKCKGAKDGLPTDQGGHLIGSNFDGAGEQINLVPMTSDLNLSKWATMENNWRNLLSQTPPKSVKIKIDIEYGDPLKPGRPTGFRVIETIDGVVQSPKIFNN